MQRILPEQHLLEEEESWQSILKYIPDADLQAKLHGRWSSGRQAIDGDINTFRWRDLVSEVDKVISKASQSSKLMLLSFRWLAQDGLIAWPPADVQVHAP